MTTNPFELLTPDELLRADNQLKLLKLELYHDVQIELFDEETPPKSVGEFLDSLFALEEMQHNPRQTTLYDLIGRPPFQPETNLSNSEVMLALEALLRQMGKNGITLEVLAPHDYEPRTIYKFLTKELLSYEVSHKGWGSTANFIYEEFHPNYRYDIVKQSNAFLNGLTQVVFDQLNRCLADQFLNRQTFPYYAVSVQAGVMAHLNELVESWLPRTLREGSVQSVRIADDTETAQATLLLHLGVDGDPKHIVKEGIIYLSRSDLWWVIERVVIDGWILE